MKRKHLVYAVVFLVLAVLVYLQFRTWKNFDWARLFQFQLNWAHILHGVGYIFIAYFLRAVRWKLFLRPVRKQASVLSLLPPTLIGFTGLALLGRPGELIRPYLIARRENLQTGCQFRPEISMQALRLSASTAPAPPVAIYSLGQLEILIDGIPVRIDGRGPRKPLELLSVLIVTGAHGTSIGAVADILWPEADGFDAYRSLITTVFRLRRLLGHRDAVHLGAGRIRLEPTICEVDAWRFEHAISVAKSRDQVRSALAGYGGTFMEESDNAWVIGMRTRLQHSITQAVRTIEVPAAV